MKDNKKDYGKITVGYGTQFEKELKILEFVQTTFKDNRLITVSKIEDESFSIAVENPKLSGRNEQSAIWLSKESLIGFMSTVMIYFNLKNEDLMDLLRDSMKNKNIEYMCSDNLEKSKL